VTNFERSFSGFVIRWRWLFVLAMPLVALILAGGMRLLEPTTDYRIYFSQENPQLKAFEALENTYTQDDNVLFLLVPAAGEPLFSKRVMQAVQELTERAWQIPYSIRVDSLTNFQHTEARGDELFVGELVEDAGTLSEAALARVQTVALNEPALIGRLIPESADVTAVNVTIQFPRLDEGSEVPEVVAAVREIAAHIEDVYEGMDVRLSGIVMLNHAFSESAAKDMQSLVPVSILVMLIALGGLLGSLSAVFVTIFVIFLSVIAGLGAGGYLGYPVTPPSASAPTIILTVAIASSVHVILSFFSEMGRGQDRRAAAAESLRINFQPVFLTGLTTAIGFLSLNFASAPPFRHLGTMVAVGVAVSVLLALTFLPALLSAIPMKPKPQLDRGRRSMERLGRFVCEHRRPLLWGGAAIAVLLIGFLPRNELDDAFVRYFDQSVEFRQDADFVDQRLGGLYRIDYSLDSGEPEGINDPRFQASVDDLVSWLRDQPDVVHVNAITDTLRRLNKNMHGDDDAHYRLPASRELSAQYLLLYEMSLPYGLDLNNQIDVGKSATRISATVRAKSTQEILALEQRISDWLEENAPDLLAIGSSPAVMFAHIGERNVRSMLWGTTFALLLISLVLVIAFRSIKVGLISMIPNLLPAALGFGLWGLLVGEVGVALSVVTGMTLGIVVDDTVHFLSKYLRARRELGLEPAAAVVASFSTVGMALLVTTLVLVAGFLVLTLSSFYPNAGMGLLSAIVLGFALLADFFLLPPLLTTLEEKKDAKAIATAADHPG
jgi:predicted RND superfamily exporter protein